jgi:hypothetical protein
LKDGGGNSFDICLDSQDRIVDPEGGAAKINGEFVARSPLKVDMRKSSSSTGTDNPFFPKILNTTRLDDFKNRATNRSGFGSANTGRSSRAPITPRR